MPMTRQWMGVAMVLIFGLGGCSRHNGDKAQTAEERFAHLEKVDLAVKGGTIRAWVARSDNDIEHGLMFVTETDMQPYPDGAQKGMFFYFDRQRATYEGFWMRNVPIPLDIAFLKADGTVITVETMAPFDERSTRAAEPYRFALETRAGLYRSLGLEPGDTIAIPAAILNSTP